MSMMLDAEEPSRVISVQMQLVSGGKGRRARCTRHTSL